MRLHRLRVDDFRGIDAYEVALAPEGVTVIEAPNEAGKSSLLDAVDLLLHEKDSSRKRAVRDVKPVGRDVGSRVEVELTCGEVHLTCVKRFNKQPMTELTVHAPTREQRTGAEAHDRLRELLEARVDLALLEALRFPQGRGLDGVALGRSNVVAARLDEVAGGHGETGDDDLLARARDEFEAYFTPTGQDGKRLREADAAAREARERRDELAERLHAVEEEVAALEARQREHADLASERAELLPRIEEHRGQRRRVERLRREVAEADAGVERARGALADVRRDAQRRADAVAGLEDLEQERAALTERLRPAEERMAALEARLAEATEALTRAESAAADAERDRERAHAALRALQLADEHARLTRRRDEADRVRERVAEARRFLETCAVTDALLAELREADEQARVARRTLAAGAPEVTLRAHRPLTVTVDGEHHAVGADDVSTHAVAGHLALDVPGLAGLEVRAGTSLARLREEVEAADRRRDDACRRAGVPDPGEAEALARRRREHEEALRRSEEELARLLDGLAPEELAARCRELEEQRTGLAAAHEGPLPATPADAEAALATARERQRGAAEALERARAERDAVRDEIAQRRDALVTDRARAEQLDAQIARVGDDLERDRGRRSDRALEEDVAAAEKQLAEAEDARAELTAALDALDPEQVDLLTRNAEQRLEAVDARLGELGGEISSARTRLEVAGEEGLGEQLALAEDELAHAEREQRRLRARARAARVLYEELCTAREEAYRSYRQPLRELITDQGRVVFGDDLDVELDEELRVVRRTLGGDTLPWEQLSSGAREQLAILSALAAARLAAEDGVPLVLDDALGYSDPDRLERLGAVLGATSGAQVIVLTCIGERYRHVGGARTVRLAEARPGDRDRLAG